MLRLEHEGFVALPVQLESSHQAGDAAADDDDPFGALRPRFESLLGDRERVLRYRRVEHRLEAGVSGRADERLGRGRIFGHGPLWSRRYIADFRGFDVFAAAAPAVYREPCSA